MKKIIMIAVLMSITFTFFAKDNEDIQYTTIEKKGMTFSWRINNDMMDIKLFAPAKGWISVGFDPKFKMKNADFIVCYISDGKIFVIDSYGTGSTSHKADKDIGGKNNVSNITGKEDDKGTSISFSIPINSKDKFDKKLKKGKHVVLLAYSSIDNLSAKHKMRTSLEIEIK